MSIAMPRAPTTLSASNDPLNVHGRALRTHASTGPLVVEFRGRSLAVRRSRMPSRKVRPGPSSFLGERKKIRRKVSLPVGWRP